jgi:hypothetical protein
MQFLADFPLIGFLQSEKGCGSAVPSNAMPKSFAVPAHDLERAIEL